MTVNWNRDLGSPTQPCEVHVEGLGDIRVTQEDIDRAEKADPNSNVDIADDTAFSNERQHFILGRFNST